MNTADDLLRRAFGILYELNGFDILNEREAKVLEDIEAYLDAPEMKDEPVADEKLEDLIDEIGRAHV